MFSHPLERPPSVGSRCLRNFGGLGPFGASVENAAPVDGPDDTDRKGGTTLGMTLSGRRRAAGVALTVGLVSSVLSVAIPPASAASIGGCSSLQFVAKLVPPLVKPAMPVVASIKTA